MLFYKTKHKVAFKSLSEVFSQICLLFNFKVTIHDAFDSNKFELKQTRVKKWFIYLTRRKFVHFYLFLLRMTRRVTILKLFLLESESKLDISQHFLFKTEYKTLFVFFNLFFLTFAVG